MIPSSPNQYFEVTYAEPHVARTKAILKAHPEVRELFGKVPSTAFFVYGIVLAQVLIAFALRESPWWAVALVAYCVGAFANHALFVLIHECAHNLIYKSSNANRMLGIVANIPIVFPAAIGFRNFHLIHHRHQGELEYDADLSGPKEAGWVGNSVFRKMLWSFFFFVVEGVIRPTRVKRVKVLDGWTLINLLFLIAFFTAFFLAGATGKAFTYLCFSTVFGIGLHPLGARWIQEHYVFKPGQETYSYYGALNWVSFNVGHHNEHHDFVSIPWMRLPKLRAMAPEFYNTLYYHTSWTKLMFRFLRGEVNLFSRVIRPDRNAEIVRGGASAESLNASFPPISRSNEATSQIQNL